MKTNIIISFLGPDGSGKSTLIKKLKKKLTLKNATVSIHHLKPNFIKKKKFNVVKNPHGQIPRSSTVSLIKIIYWLIVYRFYFLLKIIKPSNFILFDRYADDILIDPIRYRYKLNKKITETILCLFPRPDIWIILYGNPRKIWLRKKEIKLTNLVKLLKKYKNFANQKENSFIYKNNNDLDIINKIIDNQFK